MKVKLIDYTVDALPLLLYTKNTRLQGGQSKADIVAWPEEKKLEHLAYMRDTIKSSWEFVNYTFEISGVTRAFTHQLVRTRNGRYAQESMRTVDVSGAEVMKPDICEGDTHMNGAWNDFTFDAMANYEELIHMGMPVQDARGILPTNVTTSIIAQFSLRTLHEMAIVRLCTRTQGEYQDVFREMKQRVVEVHPWAEDFIQVGCVNTGVCVFPRYTECPINKLCYNGDRSKVAMIDVPHDIVLGLIKKEWEGNRHEATPKAKDGTTM